jgi:hypothetical protein
MIERSSEISNSKAKPDVFSILIENFSWLELGIFIINVVLYLGSLSEYEGTESAKTVY